MVVVAKSFRIVLLLLVFFVAANHANAKTITRGDSAILKWTVTGGGTSCMGTTNYQSSYGDGVATAWNTSHSPDTGQANFAQINGNSSSAFPQTYTFWCQDLLSGLTGSDTLTINDCSGTNVWNGTACVACSNGGCTGGVCNNGANNPPTCSSIPTVTLLVSTGGGTRSSEVTINNGQPAELTWDSTNAASCGAAGGASWLPSGSPTFGNVSVSPTVTSNYQVVCSGANSNIATVTVLDPRALISASKTRVKFGDSTIIGWSARNATSCNISGSGLVPNPRTDFDEDGATTTQQVSITAQSTYTISCLDSDNAQIPPQSVTVNILPIFQEF